MRPRLSVEKVGIDGGGIAPEFFALSAVTFCATVDDETVRRHPVSSETASWVFCSDWNFQNPYAGGTQFGPAIDSSWVEALGIKNNDMSSLYPIQ